MRRTLSRWIGIAGGLILVIGIMTILSSPSFICSFKTQDSCGASCVWSCSENCFCTANNHEQGTWGAVIGLVGVTAILGSCSMYL